MKFCIDDANLEMIRRIYEYYPVDGVSTNPTILARTGREPGEVLREIRSVIGEEGELFVQATAGTAEGIAEEAHRIVEVLGRTTLVKVPCVPDDVGDAGSLSVRTPDIRRLRFRHSDCNPDRLDIRRNTE